MDVFSMLRRLAPLTIILAAVGVVAFGGGAAGAADPAAPVACNADGYTDPAGDTTYVTPSSGNPNEDLRALFFDIKTVAGKPRLIANVAVDKLDTTPTGAPGATAQRIEVHFGVDTTQWVLTAKLTGGAWSFFAGSTSDVGPVPSFEVTSESATTGTAFAGPLGVLQIVAPDTLTATEGMTLSSVHVYSAPTDNINELAVYPQNTDDMPDTPADPTASADKDIKVTACPDAAPAATATASASATPAASSTPAAQQPAPQPAQPAQPSPAGANPASKPAAKPTPKKKGCTKKHGKGKKKAKGCKKAKKKARKH